MNQHHCLIFCQAYQRNVDLRRRIVQAESTISELTRENKLLTSLNMKVNEAMKKKNQDFKDRLQSLQAELNNKGLEICRKEKLVANGSDGVDQKDFDRIKESNARLLKTVRNLQKANSTLLSRLDDDQYNFMIQAEPVTVAIKTEPLDM